MFLLIALPIIYYLAYCLYQHFFPPPNIDPHGKYVLISGCDSGFGHGLAIELDQQGFNVLAGVFVPENVTSLKNELSPKATVFCLDITKQEDIDAAFELVKKKTDTLHALVNNSGIADGCFIDWTPLDLLHKVMNVNFFGHVAMTKKFLPLLIAKRDSRVVNLCSISGFITFPSASAYSASKYAFESFSDCLRREMAPWSLRVSIIEPGAMRTPIIKVQENELRNLWNNLSDDVQERWGIDFFNAIDKQRADNPMIAYAENPIKVVRAIQHAVTNTKPRIRYRPGWQSKLIFTIFCITPTWLIDKLLSIGSNLMPAGVRDQVSD